jgi:hypothetical protein
VIPALDTVLPDPEHTERHARLVMAPPDLVWDALASISPSDNLFARTVIGLRKLPVRLAHRNGSATLTGRFIDTPPVPVLVRAPGEGFVAAGAGTPWRIFGGPTAPHLDLAGFRSFTEPGWVKMALDFRLEAVHAGTLVSTETRVRATDPAARRAFGLYWRVVAIPSALLRRALLREIDRRSRRSVSTALTA